ncbi:MAG: Methionyl-tRNA formyltransferase [Parcubacteria group bacterium GW2011_GWA2_39_18]|nr:MAG: Methionyl-tRNA formyltransferase [Parcubacteria group bacterium GW2011_GWA2_39_18]
MLNNKYKIIFFGSAEFSVPILEILIQNKMIDAVISSPPKPIGRRQIITPTPVSQLAAQNQMAVFEPENLNDEKFLSQIKKIRPDLFLVAAYGKILPKIILEIPSAGAINVHGSLLPKYRGSSPLQAALLNGDKETGLTFILMDEKVDHGPILVKKKIKIKKNCTYSELSKEMSFLAAKITPSVIEDFLNKKIKPLPQNEDEASYVKTIKKEDGHVDFNMPADKIQNPIGDTAPKLMGAVIKYKNQITIQTFDRLLLVKKLQLEGQKSMDISSFLNGHTDFVGSQLF